MSTFHGFERLAPELRYMIWDLALREEAESRLVIVHRPTMRVMPHPSLKMTVMNACPESREYAQEHFYKIKLDVRTLVPATLSIPYELAAFAGTSAARTDAGFMYSGRYGGYVQADFRYDFWTHHLLLKLCRHVAKLLRTPGPKMMEVAGDAKSGIGKGVLFLSLEHDRFALSRISSQTDLCERAFLLDHMSLDYAQVKDDYERIVLRRQQPRPSTLWNPASEFHARHVADALPESVMQKIRRVVHLHTGSAATLQQFHICNGSHVMRARDWKLRYFQGADQFYTAKMVAVPSDSSQGFQDLVEWERVEDANGRVTFKCMCSNGNPWWLA